MQRKARSSRPQLVCVLADNSGSMLGPKAEAATQGIREMLMKCQSQGPRGPNRSFFLFTLISFGSAAEVDPGCSCVPVRSIDPESIDIKGNGGGTNITQALEIAYRGLATFMDEVIQPHPERCEFPLPIILLFSDGYNGHGNPLPIADKIKALNVDGDSIVIACAGVSTNEDEDGPDEALLTAIASPECYLHVERVSLLSAFLAEVGSSAVSTPKEVAKTIRRLTNGPRNTTATQPNCQLTYAPGIED